MNNSLPKGVEIRTKSGFGIQINYTVRGERIKKQLPLPHTPDGIAEAAAIRRRLALAAKTGRGHVDASVPKEKWGDLTYYYAAMFKEAKKRAVQRELPYELSRADQDDILSESGGRCRLTGIAFNLDRLGYSRCPYAPSLDRIDSSQGYTRNNVRLVCIAANYAMNEWGEAVLSRVAAGYVRTVTLAPEWYEVGT